MRHTLRLLPALLLLFGARDAGADPLGFSVFTPLANSVAGGSEPDVDSDAHRPMASATPLRSWS